MWKTNELKYPQVPNPDASIRERKDFYMKKVSKKRNAYGR